MKKIILSVIVAIMMVAMITTTASATHHDTLRFGVNIESDLIYHPEWRMSVSFLDVGGFVPVKRVIEVGAGVSVGSIRAIGVGDGFGQESLLGGFAQVNLRNLPLFQARFLLGELGGESISLAKIGIRIPIISSHNLLLKQTLFVPYIGYRYTQWGLEHHVQLQWRKHSFLLGKALLMEHFSIRGELIMDFHSIVMKEWIHRWTGFSLAFGVTF